MQPSWTSDRVAIIVGDKAPDRSRAKAIFGETGFTVCEAGSGPEALACLRIHGPHAAVAFIEYELGGDLAGIDLALNLHAAFPWIHVIVSTDDPAVFEELPCACVLALPWRQLDLIIEAERVAHFGSTDELSQAHAARLVTAHVQALEATMGAGEIDRGAGSGGRPLPLHRVIPHGSAVLHRVHGDGLRPGNPPGASSPHT